MIVAGPPASGKSTLARRLAAADGAIRLEPDAWIERLGLDQEDEGARDRVEALQRDLALELLDHGQVVVLDWGAFARAKREALRAAAREHGARVELHELRAPAETLYARMRERDGRDAPAREDFDAMLADYEPVRDAERAGYDPPLRPVRATGQTPGIGSLALTFDDGPDPRGTPEVLHALARARVRATFFLVGARVRAHPDLVRAILDAGHAVGVHCEEHVRHTEREAAWVARDLARALGALRAAGARPHLWRVPWGCLAPFSARLARSARLRLVGWSVDTHDWRGDRAEAMLEATRPRLRDGGVVLAHDGLGPGARREDAGQTARYVTLLAELAARRGLALAPLS